jgi:hypothetical protein
MFALAKKLLTTAGLDAGKDCSLSQGREIMAILRKGGPHFTSHTKLFCPFAGTVTKPFVPFSYYGVSGYSLASGSPLNECIRFRHVKLEQTSVMLPV